MAEKPKPLTDLESLEQAAGCLKMIAHPWRLRMIQMLLADHHMVSELAEACNNAPNMASEHLRLMQRAGLLESKRAGRRVYYKVAEPHLADIIRCIEARFG
tara:strand:+ start:7037 stop:7339 length:303 start_codon:yes stop_codon:yes gene_type:complete